METKTIFLFVCLLLIGAKWVVQFWLEQINRQYVNLHADMIPLPFRGMIDEPTYKKSVDYTLAKNRYNIVELTWDVLCLCVVLFSGVLPWLQGIWQAMCGTSVWANAGFLVVVTILLSLPGFPWEWYAQFRLEERFGFNTSTQKLWWMDRLKGIVLGVCIGYPLLVLLLKLVDWIGNAWWLWAWVCMVIFQLIMMVVAPVLILPLFNKFTPLPEGPLRERLLALARRTDFPTRDIQIMDGSKRSRHSNAFFTGLGKFRKIVLFDTLVEQLTPGELEAVLAHEIGHYKKRHIPKMIVVSALALLAGFYLISLLSQQEWFYHAFGFAPGVLATAFLLFGLLAGVFTFWFSPIAHRRSRKYEYQADAFAADAMNDAEPLVSALRKLNEKNLSNLTPHPFYSAFYYSHPTLHERETALRSVQRPPAI